MSVKIRSWAAGEEEAVLSPNKSFWVKKGFCLSRQNLDQLLLLKSSSKKSSKLQIQHPAKSWSYHQVPDSRIEMPAKSLHIKQKRNDVTSQMEIHLSWHTAFTICRVFHMMRQDCSRPFFLSSASAVWGIHSTKRGFWLCFLFFVVHKQNHRRQWKGFPFHKGSSSVSLCILQQEPISTSNKGRWRLVTLKVVVFSLHSFLIK